MNDKPGLEMMRKDSVAHLGVPHCLKYLKICALQALLTKFQIKALNFRNRHLKPPILTDYAFSITTSEILELSARLTI